MYQIRVGIAITHPRTQSPPECPLAVVNTKVNGVDGYATSDLVVPHPTRPGLWKLYGRRDDQIVLFNGEKVGYWIRRHRVSLSVFDSIDTPRITPQVRP